MHPSYLDTFYSKCSFRSLTMLGLCFQGRLNSLDSQFLNHASKSERTLSTIAQHSIGGYHFVVIPMLYFDRNNAPTDNFWSWFSSCPCKFHIIVQRSIITFDISTITVILTTILTTICPSLLLGCTHAKVLGDSPCNLNKWATLSMFLHYVSLSLVGGIHNSTSSLRET